jgi:hypothetical protein
MQERPSTHGSYLGTLVIIMVLSNLTNFFAPSGSS